MSDPNVPEGQEPNASGDGKPDNQEPQKPNTVSYDTHRRLLDEKKKVQKERDDLAAREAERERKELEQKGEWQKINEIEKARADKAEAEASELKNQITGAKKLNAVLGALDSSIDKKYYHLLDIDKIAVDPESGEINQTSVAKLAEQFRQEYPEIIKPKNGARLPNQAPAGSSAETISESEWKRLLKEKPAEGLKWKRNQIIWGN